MFDLVEGHLEYESIIVSETDMGWKVNMYLHFSLFPA